MNKDDHRNSGHTNSDDIVAHYNRGFEENRLKSGNGRLEFERTCELLMRFLPEAPATVLDVGGGPGDYACWLARKGYQVHLTDIVPLHVEQAARRSAKQPDAPLASVSVGDARDLAFADNSCEAVIMLGPLYHLTERTDRLKALTECYRVLKPGGCFFGAGISRFASTFDGLRTGYLKDPEFQAIVERDLTDGQHRNVKKKPGYFMDTFFHHPDELRNEVGEAGFTEYQVLGIEGPAWLAPEFETWWGDDATRRVFLKIAQMLEAEPSMLGVSAHLMVCAKKS